MNNLEDEIRALVAGMDTQNNHEQNPHHQPEDIQDVYVLIVREQEEDQTQVVDSTTTVPAHPTPLSIQQDSFLSAYLFVCFSLFLIASTIAFQLYCIANPLIATVTIIPKSQQVALNGTVQLGRVLPPLTISQSQTTKTTGTGHQAANQAYGYLTFYNGQFQMVTIAQGTILTGASGIQVMTDQDALIPAGNPSTGYGHITVSAHAINTGSRGNIPAYDINSACCATSILAANLSSFTGGQDERTYATVTQHDIHSISTVLKTTLAQSITGALQGQLKPSEQLQLLPCSPTVTSDHQVGEEATTVKVTVSQTCSAVAYNSQELESKVAELLSSHASSKLAGYSLFGTLNVSVIQASIASTTPHLVFLSFKATDTWIYGISNQSQEQIKQLIAGKNTQVAKEFLASLPGIEHAAIRFTGIGDTAKLPKEAGNIHIILIVV